MEYTTTITREDENGEEKEIEITIEYTISKYYPATMYDCNGDPGSPEEGGDLEIESIVDEDGNEYNEDDLDDTIIVSLYEYWDDDE